MENGCYVDPKEEGRIIDDGAIRYGECLRSIHHYVSKHYPDLDTDDIVQEALACFLARQCHVDTNQSYIGVLFRIADDTDHDTRLRR